jgi:uroporphyrinogen-III synthase
LQKDIYLLNDEKYEGVKNLSVFDINFLHVKIDCSKFDAVIFTSKNAVLALEKIDKNWKNLEIYSIGKGTSKFINELGGNVFYEAKNSYGDEFAEKIIPFLKEKKVLFPRAKVVASDVFGILKSSHINIEEYIVYENICKKLNNITCKPAHKDIIIFTSPSSVKCFLNYYKLHEENIIIAIGKKTAEAIPKNFKIHIPSEQTIVSCVEFAKKLSKNYL